MTSNVLSNNCGEEVV